jgi:hypothetical protein
LRYEEIHPKTRAELVRAFESGNDKLICDALYSAAQHEPDWRWAQNQILGFLEHPSTSVKCAALQSLGEIAVFRQVIDHELVIPRVHALLNDPVLGTTAETTLDDIRNFVKTQ